MRTVEDIKLRVRDRYGRFAEDGGAAEACCAAQAPAGGGFAVEYGLYSDAEMAALPDTARKLSRGCGNPLAFAGLRPGESVADFGCGGGIDVILAAGQVGRAGRVMGVDMTTEMIRRAREAVTEAGLTDRIELVATDIAHTGLPDASVDVVISNCVINLSPEKGAVYREIFRVLRPGGRIAVSDIVLREAIDPELAARFTASWAGCMGGAIPEADYLHIIAAAGFPEPTVSARATLGPQELAAMSCCPGQLYVPPPPAEDLTAAQGTVVSIKFTATNPTTPRCDLIVMPILGAAKKRLGMVLDSAVISGEGTQNLLCAYLAAPTAQVGNRVRPRGCRDSPGAPRAARNVVSGYLHCQRNFSRV